MALTRPLVNILNNWHNWEDIPGTISLDQCVSVGPLCAILPLPFFHPLIHYLGLVAWCFESRESQKKQVKLQVAYVIKKLFFFFRENESRKSGWKCEVAIFHGKKIKKGIWEGWPRALMTCCCQGLCWALLWGHLIPLNNLLGRGSQPHFITYEDIEAQTSVTHSTATQTDNW